MAINDRSTMWLTAGEEIGNEAGLVQVRWAQPEIVLYDRVRSHGHGYPDVITTAEGEIYITETYKSSPRSEARVHHISSELVKLLFSQATIATMPALAAGDVNLPKGSGGANGSMPTVTIPSGSLLPNLLHYQRRRYGLTIDLTIDLSLDFSPDSGPLLSTPSTLQDERHGSTDEAFAASGTTASVLVDGRHWFNESSSTASTTESPTWTGMLLSLEPSNGTITIELRDTSGAHETWLTDPTCSAQLLAHQQAKTVAQAAVVLDAGPQLILFMVNGRLCDGGPTKDLPAPQKHMFSAGWHPMRLGLGDLSGAAALGIGHVVRSGAVYGRALYTTELVGAYRAAALARAA
jgi:hypothetical protein